MTALAIFPTSSCLVQSTRKRKRTSDLHVRFCTQPQNIIYTYSESDYDRSGLIPDVDSPQQKQQYIVALSFDFIHKDKDFIQPTQDFANPGPKKSKLSKRPKLTIDTSKLGGPLYFTNMTTNHQKKQVQEELEEDEGDILTKENTRRNSLPLLIF